MRTATFACRKVRECPLTPRAQVMVPLARVCDDRDLPVQDGLMFLDVNGVRLHVLVFGDGPRTLVAVGGWTGSWEVWEEPIAQLTAGGWRCVAYDHRGSGESPVDPALITVEAMVDDVADVLDALGVERCIL